MKRLFDQWQLIAAISLIFPIVGCATQPSQSQAQMMATDREPISRLEEIGVARQQMPLPQEPLLFAMAKNLPPSAMLRDQEGATAPGATQSLREAEKPRPIPMPFEPKPK
jgi:hypothetical protein